MGNFTKELIRKRSPKLNVKAARAAMAALQVIDLSQDFDEEVVRKLLEAFDGHQVRAPRLQPGVRLFRGQICDKPTNIRRLGYPPPAIAPQGRANRAGRPMLYCCASRAAPFFELQPTVGQTVALAHWTTTAPMIVNHAGYTHTTFVRLGSVRKYQPRYRCSTADEEISAGFADLFTRKMDVEHEGRLYKLTSTIADFLTEPADQLDGLIYPSVAMRANSDNLALKPRYADRHLKFEKAELIRIDSIDDFSYKVTVLDTAKALGDDGSILWRGRSEGWVLANVGDRLMFTIEQGKWVARDMAGNIVEAD